MSKIKLENTREFFEEYQRLVQDLKSLGGIVQNDMIVEHSTTVEFFDNFDDKIRELQKWRVKLMTHMGKNFVTDEEAEQFQQQLEERWTKRQQHRND